MATQKRRVIYFTDEDWQDLKDQAADRGISISEFVRQKLLVPSTLRPVGAGTFSSSMLRLAEAAAPTFAQFRPVPKPGK